MEYLLVRFPDQRTVIVNGFVRGRTNMTFRVESGTHTIELGEPFDYTPTRRRATVRDTSPFHPQVVTFDLEETIELDYGG